LISGRVTLVSGWEAGTAAIGEKASFGIDVGRTSCSAQMEHAFDRIPPEIGPN